MSDAFCSSADLNAETWVRRWSMADLPGMIGAKGSRFSELADALAEIDTYDRAGKPFGVFVPGRIELLGKHTDYAGGYSLTVAAEQGFFMAAQPRNDNWISVLDAASGENVRFEMTPEIAPPLGCWSNYPMTVARRLARNFPGINRGADIAFTSDLPRAAGMSSSSALMVAIFLVLAEINQLSSRDEYRQNIRGKGDLAAYLATVENGRSFASLEGDLGVGTLGGSEDHTAILCSEANHVSQYSYCPVTLERRTPLPRGCVFVVGVSGVVAEKTGAAREKYNAASRSASALLETWRRGTDRQEATLAAALHSSPDAADRLKALLQRHCPAGFDAASLETRLEHFIVENESVIPAAVGALAAGDLAAFGKAVDRSQHATEHLLANQVPETLFLAAEARRQGALAASAFGAGFGGSVWAVIERERAAQFQAAWDAAYQKAFPQHAEAAKFFAGGAGPAAFVVELA